MQDQEKRLLVGNLRGLLRDATPRKASNDGDFRPEDMGARAMSNVAYRWASARLEVQRLASRHGWQAEVDRSLQGLGGPPLKYLGPGHLEQLEEVLAQLRELEAFLEGRCRVRETRAIYAA